MVNVTPKTFEQMCDDVFHWESGLPVGRPGRIGVFSNTPDDKGGPTRWGITQATLAGFRRQPVTAEDVANLSEAEATEVYRKLFWSAPGFDRLPLGSVIAEEVFDTGVGSGPVRAIMLLQQALTARGYPVDVDGKLGAKTIAAVDAAWELIGGYLVVEYIVQRKSYYDWIAARDPSQAQFLRGWHARADMLAAKAAATEKS